MGSRPDGPKAWQICLSMSRRSDCQAAALCRAIRERARMHSGVFAFVLRLCVSPAASQAQTASPTPSPPSRRSVEEFPIPLPIGQRTRAQLVGDRAHAYLADLRQGQYVSVVLHRPGAELDVVV